MAEPASDVSDTMRSVRPSDRHMGFSATHSVGKLAVYTFHRFWRACSAVMLILILCYWLYGGVLIFGLLLIALGGAFYNYQDMLLYYPEQPESARVFVQTPNTLGLPYENVYLKTQDDVRINGYFITQPTERIRNCPTFLYFHGNAGNIGHRLHNAQALYSLCGGNVMLLEYRGYGKSEGTPSEAGIRLDAQAALEFLTNRHEIDINQIVIFGRSLGGAVAIDLMSNSVHSKKAFAMIVENTFTSIPMMATEIVSGMERLPMICFRNQVVLFNLVRQSSSFACLCGV